MFVCLCLHQQVLFGTFRVAFSVWGFHARLASQLHGCVEPSEHWRLCPVVNIYHSTLEKNEVKYSFSSSQIYLAYAIFHI